MNYNNFRNYALNAKLKWYEALDAIKGDINIKIEAKNYQLDYINLAENWKGLQIFNLITFITFLSVQFRK